MAKDNDIKLSVSLEDEKSAVLQYLTRREWFAAIALQGLLANPFYNTKEADTKLLHEKLTLESIAVKYADFLIAELDNKKEAK